MSEYLEWIDEDGIRHHASRSFATDHLRKFYNEYYGGFEELEAVLTRYHKMYEDYNLLKEALIWIQRNPGAHPNNVQSVVKSALDKVKS